MLPVYRNPDEPVPISPRRKGVKQGASMLLGGVVLVSLLGIMVSFTNSGFLYILNSFLAVLCFVGGPLRMLYAGIFEEGAPKPVLSYGPPMGAPRPQFGPPMQHQALPPPPARQTGGWRSRPNTAELAAPPSVTENTTRLLEKEDRSDR